MIDMSEASEQIGSMAKRSGRTKNKTSVPTRQWKKLNEVREDESDITWNAFSPPQRSRTGSDLSSQSSQSQGAASTVETSPSVFFGAKKPVSNAIVTTPVQRPKRPPTFARHRSREDLMNQVRHMGKKPTKKAKSGSYESSENTEPTTEPNSTSPATSSGDFPDDGLDDEMNELFESSQAIITSLQKSSRPSPPEIPETPKRATACRVLTRSRNPYDSVIIPASISTRLIQPTNSRDSTTNTINEQLLQLNTGAADYNDSLMNEEDDELFSQLPY